MKELEMLGLSYQEKLQQFSEKLDEDNLLLDRNSRSIGKSNLTHNTTSPQNMYLNNFIEDKGSVFEEFPYLANTLNVKRESLKEEDDIEIKEEKLYEFKESDQHVDVTEITAIASDILTIKTENVENTCYSIKSSQLDIDTTSSIDDIVKNRLKKRGLSKQLAAVGNKSQLNRHSLRHDNNAELFNCSNCAYVTTRKRDLQKHLRNHESLAKTQLSLRCEDCPYETGGEGIITTCSNSRKKHMKTRQTKPETFECQKCDYVTRKRANLLYHMLNHQDNYKFQCYNCSYWTKSKGSLVRHMLIHQENYNFPCDECDYRAKSKSHLMRHMSVHQDNYNFPCGKCNYQAKKKSYLVRHMLIHQKHYNFLCYKCNYQARRKAQLVTHMLIHQDNNLQCHKCNYQAKRKSHLERHMLAHRNNYNFTCDKCHYRAKVKSHLVKHMLIHQENEIFPCDTCNYQTKRKSHLKRHMLVHQAIYNFECHKCNYQAKRKDHLVYHMLRHENGKKVNCKAKKIYGPKLQTCTG